MQFLFPLIVLFGLIAMPDAAVKAASDAALLWWTRVLPSLLPYLIAAALLMKSDLLARIPKRLLPFFLLLLGALGGYPVGAKCAARLHAQGALTRENANKVCAFINLPNPVFIISVVSVGFFGDPNAAAPLLIGVYAVALFGLIPLFRLPYEAHPEPEPTGPALTEAIRDGVHSIAMILGCLMFASVLCALLGSAGVFRCLAALTGLPETTVQAVSGGLFEMTCGLREIALSPMPLSIRLALAAFFLQLGGGAILLQTASVFPISCSRYVSVKLLYAFCSAVIAGLLTPLFCSDAAVPTLASGAKMLQNSVDLLSVCLSSALGLLLVFVFTFGLGHQKRTP